MYRALTISNYAILVLLVSSVDIVIVHCGKIIKLEAENYSGKNFMYRQAASQHKTATLNENGVLLIPFCLRHKTMVSIHKVLYSNDGLPNTVKLFIDSVYTGEWISHNVSERGFYWNSVYEVGPLGSPVNLKAGPHKLVMRVISGSNFGIKDPHGIEIDVVFLKIGDEEMSKNYLRCLSPACIDSITYADRHKDRADIPSGKIVQMSHPTKCLEEDNIKIPIYHESVKQFRISALPPRYRTFWTFKDAQFEDCPEFSAYHWKYTAVECSEPSQVRTFRRSQLTTKAIPGTSNCKISIEFNLEGMFRGKTDAHIGTSLEVGILPELNQEIRVVLVPFYGLTHAGKGYVSNAMESKMLNNTNITASWAFPDFTWAEMTYKSTSYLNYVTMEIPNNAVLEHIQLTRRFEHPPEINEIYHGNNVKILKTEFDFWWRDPAINVGTEGDMEVYISTTGGEYYKGTADYIVLIEKRIWSTNGDMDQTFVLYQDGAARILPIVPHGLENYVPFGNDIVIGQADPSHARPHAPIKKLVINPEVKTLDVYYQDGGFARLHIVSRTVETNVTVTDIRFVKDESEYPFAVFRSTWVEDGRAKVDHVTVNGLPAEHVLLDDWTTRYGTNFIFFRKCISSYNTQSPDYSVEILSYTEIG